VKVGRGERLAESEQRFGIALGLLGSALLVELLEAVGRVRPAMLAV
jgi:hypothetical protein